MENNNSVKPSGINESFLEELNGTVQGEVKQEETKAFDQPGNGGEHVVSGFQMSLYDLTNNPSGILPQLTDNGESGKFLNDVATLVAQNMEARFKAIHPELKARMGKLEPKVITVATTPDANGNYIQNPTLIIAASTDTPREGKQCIYMPFVFTHMGRSTETVGSIYDKFISNDNQHMQRNRPYPDTYDRIVDDTFVKIIQDYVRDSFRDELGNAEFKPCNLEPVMMSDTIYVASVEEIASRVTEIGLSKLLTYVSMMLKGLVKDTNIATDIIGNGYENYTRLSIKRSNPMDNNPTLNQTGEPTRADFEVTLTSNNKNQMKHESSLNKCENTLKIAQAKGYIDAIPETVPDPKEGNKPVIKFRPNVIITETVMPYPTAANKLLSILTGFAIAGKNYLLYPIMGNITLPNGKESQTSPGVLNWFRDIDNEKSQNKEPSFLKLSDSKLKEETIVAILNETFLLDGPVISIDIPPFSDQSYVDVGFVTAAESTDTGRKRAAAMEIIRAAHELTNGRFPLNFPFDKIFASSVSIPMGYCVQTNGMLRDLRIIDFPHVISGSSKNMSVIEEYYSSCFNRILPNGRDPFMAKINVYKELGYRDAKITGVGKRLTFTAEFMQTLYNAAREIGFYPEVDIPGVQVTEKTTFGDNHFNTATINNMNPYTFVTYDNSRSGYFINNHWSEANRYNGY